MANSVLGFDISAYQETGLNYFKWMKQQGAKFLFVKLTEGTGYRSPVAGTQIYNADKAGIPVIGGYHYFMGNGKAEALQFLATVKSMNLDKTTPLAIDVEDPSISGMTELNSQVNAFLNTCWAYGYRHLYVYSMASWFWSSKINTSKLDHGHLWVANIGGSIGVNNTTIWQYTWTYGGKNLDADRCFFPERLGLNSETTKSTPKTPDYWSTGSEFKVKADAIQGYTSPNFSDATKKTSLFNKGLRPKGYTLYAKPVKQGNIYRLKTDHGTWYTANSKYVEKIK